MLTRFSYERAASIRQAVEAGGRSGARLLAGGTDLLGCLRDGVFTADSLVSLNGLAALGGIKPLKGGGLRIGALATLAEIAESPQVAQAYPVLAQAAASVASPQIRSQGTLGGNLCQRPRCWYFRGDFPCKRKGGAECSAEAGQSQMHAILGGGPCYMVHPSDTAPALVALDAKAVITGRKGTRTVPLAAFFVPPSVNVTRENVLAPGEVLTEILLDAPPAGARSLYRKVRERASFDFALAGAALVLTLADGKVSTARVVLSGVAPVPWRSAAAEKALVGKPLDAASISAAAEAAVSGAVPLVENGYKVPLVRGIVEEALTTLAA